MKAKKVPTPPASTMVKNRAAQVFRSREAAGKWLRTPNRALDGRTPAAECASEAGLLRVEQLLGRIEHGVYS